MYREIREKIKEADLLLIGIGEDMDQTGIPNRSKEEEKRIRESYVSLLRLVQDKDYFAVSLAMDGLLAESGFDREKIVEVCGTFRKIQCADNCSSEILAWDENDYTGQNTDRLPLCGHCGKQMVYNTVLTPNYAEEGYLEQWNLYKKWLQGTVNNKLLVLELGVGLKYPTVIRWPFEKAVFFNQKAFLYRINDHIYQISEELHGKAEGIKEDPFEFVNYLSNSQ